MNAELIGYAAASLTTVSFVPQAIKVIHEKDTKAISLSMYAMFSSGVLLWLVYGVMREQGPLIVANAITLALALIILYRKLRDPR